ncbi:MAG TPA: extracellular solute-binding protein [Chloroflexota bacterium]|nr:extracellular solute-binding protein [Chloroflexota bacterium]
MSERLARWTRRRHLARLTAGGGVVLSGPLGAACGAATGGEQSSRPLDKSQKDELTWLVWSSDGGLRKEAYDAMVRRFNEQLPNVAVNRIAGGGETLEKLITMMASDTRVDVVGTRPDYIAAYMEGPRPLQDLRQFVKRDSSVIKDTDHVEGIVQALTHKGSLYALPVGIYTNHAVLNQDLLTQKGIPLPAPTWTAEQALEVARRATERKETEEASTWGIYHMWGVVTHFVYSWIRGNGGEPMTPNEEVTRSQWATDPETVNTVQWLTDLSHKQGLMPVKTTGGVWGTFREGKVAIGVMETNNLYQIVEAQQQTGNQFRWDVHPLPAMKKGRYQPINGFSYGVSRNTRNPDATWELLKQVLGPAGQTDWYRLARFAPSIKSLLGGQYQQEKDAPAGRKTIADALLAAKPMPRSRAWLDIDKVVVEVLGKVREGTVSVREGLADIDRRVTAAVQPR